VTVPLRDEGQARAPGEYAVETRGLARKFGDFKAVDGVDLTIRRGEMYGFLGPNGAGKTTTLRMVLGLLKPSAGEVRLFGEVVTPDAMALKRRVGVAFEQQSFYDEMTALEYLLFFGRLYQVEQPA
jgi:ABC-type multidrug transport system ATPase subunit